MSEQLRRGHLGYHTWVRDGGVGEDVRSETLQTESVSTLSLREGRSLCVCVGLRLQDKNVFDIACNCVMFVLCWYQRGPASANSNLIDVCLGG